MEAHTQRRGEGEHSRSVSLAAREYCSTQRSRARTQYNPQSSSRVLRIRAARSWVNPSCASPRSALRATSAPRRTKKGLRPHRCSRRPTSPRKRGTQNFSKRKVKVRETSIVEGGG